MRSEACNDLGSAGLAGKTIEYLEEWQVGLGGLVVARALGAGVLFRLPSDRLTRRDVAIAAASIVLTAARVAYCWAAVYLEGERYVF